VDPRESTTKHDSDRCFMPPVCVCVCVCVCERGIGGEMRGCREGMGMCVSVCVCVCVR
jgi:hypothetical protein